MRPDSIACSKVGIILLSSCVGITVLTQTGFTPTRKRIKNITKARIKFITTPAMSTAVFCQIFFSKKFSHAGAPGCSGDSPAIFTKPPRGIQLSEKRVPDLFFQSFFARGGIPSPNSSTCILNIRAVL